jgi:hypothetical protein
MQYPSRLLASLLVALAGCSSIGVTSVVPPIHPNAVPPEGSALVCVVRSSAIGAMLTTPIWDNGVLVGATQGPSHFCYTAAPGEHVLTTETSDADPVRFTASAGGRYYFAHQIAIGQDSIVPIEPEQAVRVAASTDFLIVDSVPEGAALPEAVPHAPSTP